MLKTKRETLRQILIAVTLSTVFLNHLMEQICTLYARNLFIVETAWVRNMFKDGKCILAASTKFLESQYKACLKTLWLFNYNEFPNFDWLFNAFNWPIHREKEGVLYLQTWQLLLFDIILYLVFQYSFLGFAFKWLSRKKDPHIIAKLNEHVTFVSFWKVFLMPLSWLFLYGIFVYVHITCFWDINQRFIVTVIEWGFFATMRGSQCSNFI